jgi:8-oxo-dGTP pyrophosphatase MutT (NUDIX family)
MAFVGPCKYVVVVLNVGGSKASDKKIVLQREPRSGNTWISAGSILPNEDHVDVAARELREETGLTLTCDDLTLLSNNPVRVSLPESEYQLVYVFSAYVPVPFVTAYVRTHAKLVQDVTAPSTTDLDGTYVVPATIDNDGLSLTPAKSGQLPYVTRKFELLHFGYVAQWVIFSRAVTTNQLLCHEDTSLPSQFLFYSRFLIVDSGHVWMVSRGDINHMCGETPTDLRMGISAPTTNFAALTLILIETQRKAAISFRYQYGRDASELEEWLEAQPQRFAMLGIDADSYNVTSQFS